jgi:hypothetical protein
VSPPITPFLEGSRLAGTGASSRAAEFLFHPALVSDRDPFLNFQKFSERVFLEDPSFWKKVVAIPF